jgi:hypothetical protein
MSAELALASKAAITNFPRPTLEFKENNNTLGCFAVQRDVNGVAASVLHTKDVQDLMAVVYKAAIKKFFEKQKDETEFKIDPSKIEIYEYSSDCIITDGTDGNNFLSLNDVDVEDNEDLKRVLTSYSKTLPKKTALSVYRFAVELMNDKAIAVSSGVNSPQIPPTVVNIQTTSSIAVSTEVSTAVDKSVNVTSHSKATEVNTHDSDASSAQKKDGEEQPSMHSSQPDADSSRASSAAPVRLSADPAASAAADNKDAKTESPFGDNFLSDLYGEFGVDLVKTTLTKAFKKQSQAQVKDLKPEEIKVLNKLKDKFRAKKQSYHDYYIFSNMVRRTANTMVIGGTDVKDNWDEEYIKRFSDEIFV